MTTDNLKLWQSVEKTDPNHTKKVSQRGGFTAIDAHYQVQQATEAFGPVGIGWGYDCEYLFEDVTVICLLTFWHGERGNTFGPIAGCAKFKDGRIDPDAPKKAMTDGLTKALSHLGFNADVFLGKFDDNKYVEQMKQEFAPKPPTQAEAVAKLGQAIDEAALLSTMKGFPLDILKNPDVLAFYKTKKVELTTISDTNEKPSQTK